VGVLEAAVGLGQTLIVADHEFGADIVVDLASGFESVVSFEVPREGEAFEAVLRRIHGTIFKS